MSRGSLLPLLILLLVCRTLVAPGSLRADEGKGYQRVMTLPEQQISDLVWQLGFSTLDGDLFLEMTIRSTRKLTRREFWSSIPRYALGIDGNRSSSGKPNHLRQFKPHGLRAALFGDDPPAFQTTGAGVLLLDQPRTMEGLPLDGFLIRKGGVHTFGFYLEENGEWKLRREVRVRFDAEMRPVPFPGKPLR